MTPTTFRREMAIAYSFPVAGFLVFPYLLAAGLGGGQHLAFPHLHHGVQVLLPQVARIRHGVEAGLELEVQEEAPQKTGAFGPGLVRDALFACRVPGVEQADQGIQHPHRIGMARPQAGEDFLG